MGGPALQWVDPNGIFVGALFGLIIALPVSLFLSFWVSAVKNKAVVVLGAFIGAILGFLVILGWAGTLIYDTVLPGANGLNCFFGSLLFCSALALSFGMLSDLLVARMTKRDYQRASVMHE